MSRYLVKTAVLALLSGFAFAPTAFAAETGFYTADQASQGKLLFNNNCAECHRPDLSGAQGPALKGADFMAKWGGRPVSELYTFEHEQMPLTHPGALSDAEMIPITAFILSENGLPAGTEPLALSSMTATLPAPAAPATQ